MSPGTDSNQKTPGISDEESERYLRQILIFEESGQELLKNSHVFIAGCGGLGSPIAMYLAAAGVGNLTIVDRDVVSLSNLNRQLLHYTGDIGREKVISALEKLTDINPEITITVINASITSDSIHSLAQEADIIIDAVDNLDTRHILNTYSVQTGKPFIHGAVNGLSGQMMVIIPGQTACLRCLVQDPPKPVVIPVLGVTAGIIGLMQANEAIKLITGTGTLQAGRVVIWDGNSGTLERYTARRIAACPICGNMEGQSDPFAR